MNEDENTIKNEDKSYTDPITGKFCKGNPGGGRPKGKFSIKTQIIRRLEENPEELKQVVDYLIKNQQALLLQMVDGRPPQDLNLGNKEDLPFIVKIIQKDEAKGENS